MKILFVGRNAKVGGPSTFVYRACLGLRARGHEVHFAAQGGPMTPRFREAGAHFHRVWPTPFNRWQLRGLLQNGGFDVVHACNPTAGDDVVRALPSHHAPAFVVSIHGVLKDEIQGNACLHKAAQIIAFDPKALARLRKFAFLKGRELQRVYRPVETREVGVMQAGRVIAVGRLSQTKGRVALAAVNAVGELRQEFPELTLGVVGDGKMKATIEARAQEINAQHGAKVVEMLGMQVDPFGAMSRAQAVVGAAYVALEALMHEIPVVGAGFEAFGVVTPANLIEAVDCNFGDGMPGLHPDTTTALLRDGLREVLTRYQTPDGRAQLRQMRAQLEAHHSLDSVAQQLETIYKLARS